jgi:hypothetical protein
VLRFIYCLAECRYVECCYVECHDAECGYDECHDAECRYAECQGAITNSTAIKLTRYPHRKVIVLLVWIFGRGLIKMYLSRFV